MKGYGWHALEAGPWSVTISSSAGSMRPDRDWGPFFIAIDFDTKRIWRSDAGGGYTTLPNARKMALKQVKLLLKQLSERTLLAIKQGE